MLASDEGRQFDQPPADCHDFGPLLASEGYMA
jgi:hypothetical protein